MHPLTPPSRRQNLAASTALAVASLLLTLLLIEGVLRLLAPELRAHALPPELTRLDPVLGWRLGTDLELRHASPYFDVLYRTNGLGFRDEPRELAMGGEGQRLLLYGDSQIFGWGLPMEERFSNLLERRFPELEIWNLGVPGYGLDQQILAHAETPAWPAEITVLYVSQATLRRLRHRYLFGAYKPVFEVDTEGQLHHLPPSQAPGRKLLYRLPAWMHLPYFLDQRLGILDERLRGEAEEGGKRWSTLLALLLERARDQTAERDQRLFVLSDLPPKPRRELQALCRELRLPHLPIAFEEDTSRLRLGEADPHWNALAHGRIVDGLTPTLSKLLGREAAGGA